MIAIPSRYCDRTLQLLLRTVFRILLLRSGPDALPASHFLFAVLLLVVIAVGILQKYLFDQEPSSDFTSLFGLIGIHIFAYWIVLNIAGHPRRFLQAITASAACGAVVNLAAVILYLAIIGASAQNVALVLATLLILQGWLLVVDGFIISRSIETTLPIGVFIAAAIFFLQSLFDSYF